MASISINNNSLSIDVEYSLKSYTIDNAVYSYTITAFNQSGKTKSYSDVKFKVGTSTIETLNGSVTYSTTLPIITLASGTFNMSLPQNGNKSFTLYLNGTIDGASKSTQVTVYTEQDRYCKITSFPDFHETETVDINYTYYYKYVSAINKISKVKLVFDGSWSNAGGYFTIEDRELPIPQDDTTLYTYKFSLTDEEKEKFYTYINLQEWHEGDLKGFTIPIVLMTVYSDGSIYSKQYKDVKLTMSESIPTVNPSIVDINEKTVALTGDSATLIRYASTAQVTVNPEAYNGATIKEYYVTNGSTTITNTNVCTFPNVESNQFYIGATDSRNESCKSGLAPNFIEYTKLTANIAAGTITGVGELDIQFDGSYFDGSFGLKTNSIKLYYRYKAQNDEAFCDWVEITEFEKNEGAYKGSAQITGLNYQTTYIFQSKIEDEVTYVESIEKVIVSKPIFDWSKEDFNFNVPVTINGKKVLVDEGEITETEEFKTFKKEVNRLINVLTTTLECTTTISNVYSSIDTTSCTAKIVGGKLYCYLKLANQSTYWGSASLVGTTLATVTIKNSAINTAQAVSILSHNKFSGGSACVMNNVKKTAADTLQFDVVYSLNAQCSSFESYFEIPITLNMSAFDKN